jgi:hypothetical protein
MSYKNGQRLVPFEAQDEARTKYEMIHCTKVNKFFVFEFKLVEKDDPNHKVPLMNKDDFVVIFRANVSNYLMFLIGVI